MSVFSVVKIRVQPGGTSPLLGKTLDVLKEESTRLSGFVAGELLVSLDGTTVVILTEWVDQHAWSRSRYDARIGQMLEDYLAESHRIEFELYDCRAKFLGAV